MILDTNALSAWAGGNPACRPAFLQAAKLVVPTIVLGEYLYGIRQSRHRQRYEDWLAQNLPFTQVHPVTEAAAGHYASLRIQLKNSGTRIPANDLWIAAIALETSLPLLSNDARFNLIPGLNRLGF